MIAGFQNQGSVPSAMKLKALELLDLHDRAIEEQQRVRDDILAALGHFNNVHMKLTMSSLSAPNISVRALLFQKVSRLERFMQELWHIARKHTIDVPERLTLPLLAPSNPESDDLIKASVVDFGISDDDDDDNDDSSSDCE